MATKIDRMRQGFAAFSTGDLDALRELFSPDIVWHSGGDNALTGDYKVAVFHSDADERVSEAWIIPTDAAAANAFLSD